ncbi:MAG TPA: RNA polymerase sigma factor [Prevotella sp.]
MDASVFKQTFLPHSRRMYGMAFRLTGNVQASEDLVQEALLRLWLKRNALDKVVNAEAFCMTIVRNVFIDRCRKKVHGLDMRPADELNVPAEADTSRRVEQQEAAERVLSLIARLPEQQRLVITLRDVEDRSFDEIAAQTGLQAVNIRVLLSRARKFIREQFNKQTEYERERGENTSR